MEISFDELREKEVVNINSGKKMGHIVDLIFDIRSGSVKGIIVPGDRKIFKKSEDLFISLRQIKTIGDDVILIETREYKKQEILLNGENLSDFGYYNIQTDSNNIRDVKYKRRGSFVRCRRINNNKYK